MINGSVAVIIIILINSCLTILTAALVFWNNKVLNFRFLKLLKRKKKIVQIRTPVRNPDPGFINANGKSSQ